MQANMRTSFIELFLLHDSLFTVALLNTEDQSKIFIGFNRKNFRKKYFQKNHFRCRNNSSSDSFVLPCIEALSKKQRLQQILKFVLHDFQRAVFVLYEGIA